MNLPYLVPRVVRHFLPAGLTRFLLTRSWIIRPGLETADPDAAVGRYLEVLRAHGRRIADQQVLVFGYGGRFDIGVGLLAAGAASVVLCDKFAAPDDVHNRLLLPQYEAYLKAADGHILARSDQLIVLHDDILEIEASSKLQPVDLVLSTSVYEHLAQVDEDTKALAALTRSSGLQIHYVDLRDHFFKYPFEMLRYSENTWRRWLNPTSNHNRYRLWDYRRVFETYFNKVDVRVLARDERAFSVLQPHIRPEFKRGVLEDDSATLILIMAEQPRAGKTA